MSDNVTFRQNRSESWSHYRGPRAIWKPKGRFQKASSYKEGMAGLAMNTHAPNTVLYSA